MTPIGSILNITIMKECLSSTGILNTVENFDIFTCSCVCVDAPVCSETNVYVCNP